MVTDVKKELAKKLKAISEQITSEDKKLAREKFELSDATISFYLNGNGKDGRGTNLDTGLALLEFFHEKINERIERLKALA